ncbi:MAG: hypothetical protein V5788_12020 [Shewanella sp.]
MINLKTVFVLTLLTIATSVNADEIAINTVNLHATIAAELAKSMEKMHKNLTEDMDTILIASEQASESAANETQLN